LDGPTRHKLVTISLWQCVLRINFITETPNPDAFVQCYLPNHLLAKLFDIQLPNAQKRLQAKTEQEIKIT
jgi:hypothetical protein